MPTYEYRCPKCGIFDIVQSIHDNPLVNCPTCNSDISRIITGGTGFILDVHDTYYDVGLGMHITSKAHRKAVMKERNLVEVGNEWKYIDPAINRRKQEIKLEKEWNETSERVLHHLNSKEQGDSDE